MTYSLLIINLNKFILEKNRDWKLQWGKAIDNIDWPLCGTSFGAALPWLWRELRAHRAFYGREFEMYRG